VKFDDQGRALIRVKNLNALGREALKKLAENEQIHFAVCVTVIRPEASPIVVQKDARLESPCPGGKPSSVCGVVSDSGTVEEP
jgi:hypothetical protein